VVLGEALDVINVDPWALMSSLNKPYFSFFTIIYELGFLLGGVCVFFFFRTLLKGGLEKEPARVLAIFLFLLFCIDNIHANPLLWGVVLIGMRALLPVKIKEGAMQRRNHEV